MDLPIFVIAERATLLVDILVLPEAALNKICSSIKRIPINFSRLAALISADIARNL